MNFESLTGSAKCTQSIVLAAESKTKGNGLVLKNIHAILTCMPEAAIWNDNRQRTVQFTSTRQLNGGATEKRQQNNRSGVSTAPFKSVRVRRHSCGMAQRLRVMADLVVCFPPASLLRLLSECRSRRPLRRTPAFLAVVWAAASVPVSTLRGATIRTPAMTAYDCSCCLVALRGWPCWACARCGSCTPAAEQRRRTRERRRQRRQEMQSRTTMHRHSAMRMRMRVARRCMCCTPS